MSVLQSNKFDFRKIRVRIGRGLYRKPFMSEDSKNINIDLDKFDSTEYRGGCELIFGTIRFVGE